MKIWTWHNKFPRAWYMKKFELELLAKFCIFSNWEEKSICMTVSFTRPRLFDSGICWALLSVMACANIYCNLLAENGIVIKHFFHWIWIMGENSVVRGALVILEFELILVSIALDDDFITSTCSNLLSMKHQGGIMMEMDFVRTCVWKRYLWNDSCRDNKFTDQGSMRA